MTRRLTQAERSAQSDQQMFNSAIKLIVERGPDKTTLTDIGILAGYSRGLAAYRYKTKDVFFTALIGYLHHLWCEELDRSISDSEGLETVVQAVTALQNFVQSDPDHLRAMYHLYYYSIDHQSEMTQKLDEIHTSQRKQASCWAAEAMKSGEMNTPLSAEDFAEQYCALVFGAIYQWLVNPEKIELQRLLENCKTSLLCIAGSPTSRA